MTTSIVKAYKILVNKHMTVYNAFQTGFLMAGGDFIAQTVVEKKSLESYDTVRTAKFFGIGLLFVGPTISAWYKFLDKKFTAQVRQLANKKTAVFKKVALDQLIFAPVFIAAIISVIDLSEGGEVRKIPCELGKKYPDILLANYKLWPWVQLVNFYFVPLKHQVLLVQSVAVLWNTYISFKTHEN
ncbi:unnamed protein product [Brassicogethes aeneus]|uniref:Mitochondrial inner membrane protein Mpv17 n=1 Tax=Brassicogethes aeneus TaxID=1431903 RepID=A0A9P0B9N9_BRAAE|nr:unnamed protein product [Brassicogethes aeneus]